MVRKRPNTNNMSQSSSSLPHNDLDDSIDDNGKGKRPKALFTSVHGIFTIITSTKLTMTCIASALFSPLWEEQQSIILQCSLGYLLFVRPILAILSICVQNNTDNTSYSGRMGSNVHERVIATSFLVAIVCNFLPRWGSSLCACGAILAFGLASRVAQQKQHGVGNGVTDNTSNNVHQQQTGQFPKQNSAQQTWAKLTLQQRAALSTLFVVLSLLLENFLIWVVSATYPPGIYGEPAPLQDNGRIVLEYVVETVFDVDTSSSSLVRRRMQLIRNGLNVQWAIVTGLAASFVCLELNIGKATSARGKDYRRSLAGLALRALTTLALARLIRTISFVLTVLPSQVPGCYRRHFPLPPESWREWLLVGFLPNSRGGCNDLILSGHATVLTTLGCGCTSVAGNNRFSVALWTLVGVDFAIESYQGLHYSVDMWLGCVVTCLLWQLTSDLEVPGDLEKRKLMENHIEMTNENVPLDRKVVGMYALPAILGFIVLTYVPEAIVNYFLVSYAVWAAVILVKWGFTNFSQHILLCLLCVTLGSYL